MLRMTHEDVELQSEVQHALNVLIDKHENVAMPSQSNVESIVAYLEIKGVWNFQKYTF